MSNTNQKRTVEGPLSREYRERVENLLRRSLSYLEQGKAEFAPHATNSHVDDLIKELRERMEVQSEPETYADRVMQTRKS